MAFESSEAFGSVAVILRETRESFGEELRAVAQSLRIRFVYLQAIEDGRFNDLPGHTYAVGFIRTYSEYLGLDGEDMVGRFKDEVRGVERRTELVFPTPVPEGKVPGGAVILLSLLLVGLVYGGWFYLSDQGRSVADLIPEVPDRLQSLLGSETEIAGPIAEPGPALASSVPAGEPSGDREVGPGDSRTEIDAAETASSSGANAGTAAETDAAQEPASQAAAGLARSTTATDPILKRLDQVSAGSSTGLVESRAQDPAVPAGLREFQSVARDEPVGTVVAEAAAAGAGNNPQIGALASVTPDVAPAQTRPSSEIGTPVGSLAEVIARNTAAITRSEPGSAVSDADPTATPSAPADGLAEPQGVGAETSPTAADQIPQAPSTAQLALAQSQGPRTYGSDNANSRIVLRAKYDSWVQVRDGQDALLLTRVLRAGDTYRVPNQSGLTLLTGNAGGLQIEVDGRALAPLGPVGSVRRNIVLDPTRLISDGVNQ